MKSTQQLKNTRMKNDENCNGKLKEYVEEFTQNIK